MECFFFFSSVFTDEENLILMEEQKEEEEKNNNNGRNVGEGKLSERIYVIKKKRWVMVGGNKRRLFRFPFVRVLFFSLSLLEHSLRAKGACVLSAMPLLTMS